MMLQQWKLYVLLAAALSSFTLGWKLRSFSADAEVAGLQRQAEQNERQALEALLTRSEQRRADELRIASLSEQVIESTAKAQKAAEVKIRVVEREVVRYAENPDRTAVVLPADWVRVHNLAATGNGASAPSATCLSDDSPAGNDSAAGRSRERCAGAIRSD